MSRRPHRLLALAVGSLVLITACGGPETDVTTTLPGDTSTTIPSEQPAHDLADGEYFAWVSGPTGDGFILDPAELLSGEEARVAAIADGVISEGEDLPNDIYILDPDDNTHVVAPAGDAVYSALLFTDGAPTETGIDYEELAAILSGVDPDVYGVFEGVMPATVTIAGGDIVSITQVYLP